MNGSNSIVEVIEAPDHYEFRRSDGERFHLVAGGSNGNAVLHRGAYGGPRPPLGIVELDRSVPNKLDAAKAWVLAYPDHPTA